MNAAETIKTDLIIALIAATEEGNVNWLKFDHNKYQLCIQSADLVQKFSVAKSSGRVAFQCTLLSGSFDIFEDYDERSYVSELYDAVCASLRTDIFSEIVDIIEELGGD